MSEKSNIKMNRSFWCVMLPILLFAFSGSWVSGCGTGADDGECPDTSFSQTNLDTLEAKAPNFIWRVCNANEEYAMEEIESYSKKVDFSTLNTCTCSPYFSSEAALISVDYKINGNRFIPAYLDIYKATKGLIDSVEIRNSPGRYSYYFYYNTEGNSSNSGNYQVKIERETYY